MVTLQPIWFCLFVLTSGMEKLFAVQAAMSRRTYIYGCVDYFIVAGNLDLCSRNLRSNKTPEGLIADHEYTRKCVEEMPQVIFLMALASTMPQMLNLLPSPLWLNARGIGPDPQRWWMDKLFSPASPPCSLKIAEFSSMFGMTDLPALPGDRSTIVG